MPKITDRFHNAWNAFIGRDPTRIKEDLGLGYGNRPDRPRFTRGNERSIITAVYNRIALDLAAIKIEHVRLDENGNYTEVIKSGLNNCLNVEANKDQSGRAFRLDIAMSLFDEGVIAIVPVDTSKDPALTDSYDIFSMRVGKIIQWYPNHVRVRLYNENTGLTQEVIFPKSTVAIVENPLYAIMNEPNSVLQRLIRKLNLLDAIDEQSGSGKLDLIIQLPYTVKTPARRQQAEERRKNIEMQLSGSKYGIAYTDGTEKITQLNRSLENHLLEQIEYLTSMLFSQLGITSSILDGTADEKTMLNYQNRILEPIISTIVDEMIRKFISKTARTQGQSLFVSKDPFKLIPVTQIAEIADKLTRNEIVSTNEMRQKIGYKPVDDPKANELRNKNLNESEGQSFASTDGQNSNVNIEQLVNSYLEKMAG